jgi:predicted nucleic acid-binding protein
VTFVAVFDTNVLISALLSLQGSPFRCVLLARESMFGPSRAKKSCVKSKRSFKRSSASPRQRRSLASNEIRAICAAVARATHIVTGDRRHLLPLRTHGGVNPAEFLEVVMRDAGGQTSA